MNTSYTIHDCTLIDIATFTDERGTISVIDRELPFQVKRVFWLHHIAEGKDRGAHALLEGMEIMVAVHGSFVVDLDDGKENTSVLLDDPSKGLIIRPGVWFRTHSYKEDGVSLILADDVYNRDRYTYDHKEYLRGRGVQTDN